ncbi:XRE family transcriptional regulator [Collimonas pratensis]|uniref:helix-turn-helix domain-containing protein n=2 Tax=Collimonas TaxID=202907 RepID=UPI00143D52A1|nr:helix-turn-helix transcriptional regulator [Collimonas pratensis]NKI68107.1 XRE family transcriptional regulator [Collimonas pratensis]
MLKHTCQLNYMLKNTFGERLKEERTRLGLTQEALGAVGGIKKLAQISYEQDKRYPDAGYLIAMVAIGVDVQYVLLGKPSTEALSDDENELLAGYRGLDIRGKAGVLGMINGMNIAPQGSQNVKFSGQVGQVFEGDQTVSGSQTFNVGGTTTPRSK